MKFIAVLLAAFALSGCASWDDRLHGSWLDEVGKPANPPRVVSDADAATLTAEVLRLRGEAEGVRVNLSSEKDRVRRIAYLRDLREIGDRLHPMERVLRDARRTLPAAVTTTSPVAPAAAPAG